MYAKIFSSILDSSLWTQPLPTRIVWITMLAMADREGYVYASLSGLARRALVSETDCKTAIETFLGPDPESADKYRNPDNEGRKIEISNGGWQIINYPYYRSLQDSDERREQNKLAKRRQREKERNGQQSQDSMLTKDDFRDDADGSAPSPLILSSNSSSDSTATPAKRKNNTSVKDRRPADLEAVKGYWTEAGLRGNPEDFFDYWEGIGWRTKAGPIDDWKARARYWSRNPQGFQRSSRSEAPAGKYSGISKDVER